VDREESVRSVAVAPVDKADVSSVQPSVPDSKLQFAHAGCVGVLQLKGSPSLHV